ncbi:GNAT family N-acetyltransferase [Streptantibioticus silvisoli]|uniref:GNAT family N-acetyltransferase n=1 Tax=Streptantibioticus silvisoli TaxID=2705255 RepID=UPI003558A345
MGPLGLRLVAAVPRDAQPTRLPDGERIVIRAAGPGDRAAGRALHERCSPDTLSLRYHGPVGDADRYLTHLLDPRHGRTLAVEDGTGRLIALGHLLWDGEESELALLVEDAWQRRGVGTLLLRRLVAVARAERRASVYAVTRPANTAMHAAMRGLGLPLERHSEDGALVLTASMTNTGNAGEIPVATTRK